MSKDYVDVIWNPKNHGKNGKVSVGEGIEYNISAATRGIDMLLAKFKGQDFQTEVQFAPVIKCEVPKLTKPLSQAKIAFVTDGGLVPKGNPDQLPPVCAHRFCVYPLCGAKKMDAEDYEVSHQGYESKFVAEDPNRLVPLDVASAAVEEGKISSLLDFYYVTTGVMTSADDGHQFGKKIAASLGCNGVDAVIVSSTCGTSTRCGACMAWEIERAGIPVVHVTNLAHISEWIGCSRILYGKDIRYVFGDPCLSADAEESYRRALFDKALELLESTPEANTSLVVKV